MPTGVGKRSSFRQKRCMNSEDCMGANLGRPKESRNYHLSAECNQRGFSSVVPRFIIGMSMRSKGGVMHPDGNLSANENRLTFAAFREPHDRIQPGEFASEMIRKIDYFSFFSPPFSIMVLTFFRCAITTAERTLSPRRLCIL